QGFTATFPFPTALASTRTVTATVTRPNNSTSPFATSAVFTDPFAVITGTDGVIGSLRQAIIDSNVNPDVNSITFAGLPSPFVITPTAALPVITKPVTIDATNPIVYDPTNPTNPKIVQI